MKKISVLIIISVLVVLSACGIQNSNNKDESSASSAAAKVVKLTGKEAHDRMKSGDSVVILDVRTEEEYAQKHIPGAVLLPNENIGNTPPAELPNPDAEILVYCRSGNRSAQAAKKLVNMGYTRVYDFGGINSWEYETEEGK